MTEIKMENGKSNVCQNGDLGAAGVCHKIPDQVEKKQSGELFFRVRQ